MKTKISFRNDLLTTCYFAIGLGNIDVDTDFFKWQGLTSEDANVIIQGQIFEGFVCEGTEKLQSLVKENGFLMIDHIVVSTQSMDQFKTILTLLKYNPKKPDEHDHLYIPIDDFMRTDREIPTSVGIHGLFMKISDMDVLVFEVKAGCSVDFTFIFQDSSK